MGEHNVRNTFWSLGISGLIGAAIGAGGAYFTQKQANIVENQYFMELDFRRHSAMLSEGLSFEDKLENLNLLKDARIQGFQSIFDRNLKRDINEVTASITAIEKARKASEAAAATVRQQEEAAAIARQKEQDKADAAAQLRKEQAVRTNPVIFDSCGFGTNQICP